jgi:nitrogenase iron protein NifH
VVRIVVFGKGGVGKSTFSAHLSAWFAGQAKRVLHVGCDPKADSSLLLLEPSGPARTVVDLLSQNPGAESADALNRGRLGIDCIEVGGPEPGIGCGGRGITWALDFLEKGGLLARGYDVVLFDVLGDVVCGGFAAPLRQGLADLVLIVASPDEMSFFAANNIARAVVRYSVNGVALAGLVLNQRSVAGTGDLDGRAFARAVGTGILGELPFSPALSEARRRRRTLVEIAPDDPFAVAVAQIGAHVVALDRNSLGPPRPLDNAAFVRFVGGGDAPEPVAQPPESAELQPPGTSTATGPSAAPDGPAAPAFPGGGDRMAGASTLAVLDDLLGFRLPEMARARAGVAAAVLTSAGELRLTIRYSRLPLQRLILLPPGREGAYIRLPGLGIAYQGTDPTVALHKLARWVGTRLYAVSLDTLASLVARAPDSHDAGPRGTPVAEAPEVDGHGRVWSTRAGPQTLEVLSHLLGTKGGGLPRSTVLSRADSRTDGALELDFRLPDGSDRGLLLVPLGRPACLDTATCGIGHAGEGDEATLELVRGVAAALGTLTLDSLHTMVREAPDAVVHGRPGGPQHDEASFRQTPAWRQFFADDHFARNVHQLLQYEAPHVAIEHCDRECMYPTPPALEHQPDIYSYPWLDPAPYHGGPLSRKAAGGITLMTDLVDRDVVRGAILKLEDALDKVCGAIDEEQFVLVHNTCTPVVAGEDVSGLVRRTGASCKAPLMYTAPHIEGNPLAEFFARRKQERGFAPHDPRPGAINLVGFPVNRGMDELCGLLSRMGVEVNDRVFPRVDLRLFDTYLEAGVQVFHPEHYLSGLRDALFRDLPLVTLEPQAPFGFAGTRRWLAAVLEAVAPGDRAPSPGTEEAPGIPGCCNAKSDGITTGYGDTAKVIEEEERGAAPRWAELCREARTCSVGLVADAWRLGRLADPSVCFGLAIPSLLSEMGFRLEWCLYAGGGSTKAELDSAARGLAPEAECTVRFFTDEPGLETLLAESGAGAFYSDFAQDRRLARAGKAIVSSQLFEMGFAGAVRTAERLLAACRLPFFKRFGRVGGP